MSLLYPAGQAPYLTEPELTSAPTGIGWNQYPPAAQITEQQRIAERINILGRATARADGCGQPGPPRHHRHRADLRPRLPGDGPGRRRQRPGHPLPLADPVDHQRAGPPEQRLPPPVDHPAGRVLRHRAPVVGPVRHASPRRRPAATAASPSSSRPATSTGATAATASCCASPTSTAGRTRPSPPTAASGATSIAVDDCTGWAITGEFGQVGAAGHHLRLRAAGNRAGHRRVRRHPGPAPSPSSSALAFTHQPGIMVTTLPQSVIEAMICSPSPRP